MGTLDSITETHNENLPIKVKLCYGIGELGKNSLIFFNNYFLLYFYIDVIKISPGIASIILLIARILDIITDPIMGIIVDRTNSKEGKCRFYFKYFSIPAATFIFLSYFIPEIQNSLKILWILITYILQGIFSTILLIPMNTFMGRLTDNKVERVSLNQYKGILCIFPGLIIPSITIPLVTILGNTNLQRGFAITALIYAVIYALCHLICYWGTKGYEKSYNDKIVVNKFSIKDTLVGLIKNKYCLIVCLCYVLYLIYISIMNSSLVYYTKYNLNNTNLMATYSILSNITSIIPILIMGILVKKFGNSKSCAIGCIVVIIAEAIRLITRDKYIYIICLGWTLEGIGIGLCSTLIIQCMFDSIVYGQWKTGTNNEALIMSTLSFAQKIGQSLGGVFAAYILTLVPYSAGASTQPQNVLNLFFAENVILPLILYIISFFAFIYISKLEKNIPFYKQDIKEKYN